MRDAQQFASQFRYSEDKASDKFLSNETNERLEILEVHNSLLITENISPLIYESLERVTKNLYIDAKNINLYVYAGSDINAKCYNGIDDGFVIILSSSLVSLLDGKELDFVLGHELGHLLLDHTKELKVNSPEGLKLSRAKEISVDRIGLVASRDLESSLRSMIKILSGLSEKFLSFNTSEFLNQLRKFDVDASHILSQTTHPSFLIRARALMLFSTSDQYQKLFDGNGKTLLEVDGKIKRELDKYIDKSFYEKTNMLKDSFSFWLTCYAAVLDKTLSKEEQDYIAEKFGNEKLKKFKALVSGKTISDTQEIVCQKLKKASASLVDYTSLSVNQDFETTVKELTHKFKIPNLSKNLKKILGSIYSN